MRLNPNCIRDVLLYLEDNLTISKSYDTFYFESLTLDKISQDLPSYPSTELVNTILILNEGGYILSSADYSGAGLVYLEVNRITYSGYQFIEKIRPETVWKKLGKILSNAGSFSFDLISTTALEILTSRITSLLNA